jgi:hypothetical protein
VAAVELLRAERVETRPGVAAILALARELARSEPHAAWHEVMVAARTDPALAEAVAPVLRRYEAALVAFAHSLLPAGHPDPARVEVLTLTVLHAFDSEAVTRKVHRNQEVEEARLRWAVAALEAALAPPG